jgi:hypothetical protein
MHNHITFHTSKFCTNPRLEQKDKIFQKSEKNIDMTYSKEDSFEDFELGLNELVGNSISVFSLKRKFATTFFSFISVLVIMFAFISVSIYEDFMKKIIFESSLLWHKEDFLSLFFIVLFFLGLLKIPSILDAESSELKDVISSWFNKEARKLKKINLALQALDKNIAFNIYNIDLLEKDHWVWKLFVFPIANTFENVNIFVRNDLLSESMKKFESQKQFQLSVEKDKVPFHECNLEVLFSHQEQKQYSMLQLSSAYIINKDAKDKFVSLEFFEYIEKKFINENQVNFSQELSGYKNFIHRSFYDFYLLENQKSMQIKFTNNVRFHVLFDEQKRLAYYLINNIEECVKNFDEPISLLLLYYYVKDIVIDEKRLLLILEKFISSIHKQQQYEMIDNEWFKIAGEMFEPTKIKEFQTTNNSLYRKLSLDSLNILLFLFERNGHFEQALKLAQYLYEINPNKYAITISSLYERMGKYDKAYESLPHSYQSYSNPKPTDLEVRFLQRKSWIIVSQRKEDKKEEGLASLAKLKDKLFSHNESNEPLWLWHFYNISANYNEWNEEFDLAIESYKKCLSIPTLGPFEYGATFVNMAIAYRFKFLKNLNQEKTIIEEAIKIGSIGVALKESVGDRDEMPVVLHNQALNILYKFLYFEAKEDEIKIVKNITQEGIEILERTNSTKKLGMILIENIIAKFLLKEDFEEIKKRLLNHYDIMDKNEQTQVLAVYDSFYEKKKIEKINFTNKA